jgi:hypothetical protein
MQNNLKDILWIVFGGLTIGTIVQRANDSLRGIPNLSSSPLVELDSVIYGCCFIILAQWIIVGILGLVELKPRMKGEQEWACLTKKPRFKGPWIVKFCLIKTFPYLASHFVFSGFFVLALFGFDRTAIIAALLWYFVVAALWTSLILNKSEEASPTFDLTINHASAILALPQKHGPIILGLVFLGLIFGSIAYPYVSQSFGGGKPEMISLYLKPGSIVSQEEINGKQIALLFRRGPLLGVKVTHLGRERVMVIHQNDVERIYLDYNYNVIRDFLSPDTTKGNRSRR